MSTHKAGGSAGQHVSPSGKRLGFKASGGESVSVGDVLVRQRGTRVTPGKGVKLGRDHTIFAMTDGKLKVSQKLGRRVVSVVSS